MNSAYHENTTAYSDELSVILTILVKPEIGKILLNNLNKNAFSNESCQKLFIAASSVYSEYGKISKDLIYSFLSNKLWWEALSGEGFSERDWIQNVVGRVSPISEEDLVPTIDLLREKQRRRALFNISTKFKARALNTEKALNSEEIANLELFATEAIRSMSDPESENELIFSGELLIKTYKDMANERLSKEFVGLGIPSIDKTLTEGLIPPGLSIIGGPTSAGKSALLQNIALNHVCNNQPFLIFVPEPQLLRTMDRLIAIHKGIPLYEIKQAFRKSEMLNLTSKREQYLNYAEEISNFPLFIVERRGLTIAKVLEIIDRVQEQTTKTHPDKYLIWGIDLFKDLVDVMNANIQAQEISMMLQKFEANVSDNNTHGILLVQFNRYYSHNSEEKPDVSHIEFGAGYEQKAHNIFFITRPFFKDKTLSEDEIVNIWVEKQRDGRAKFKVKCKYDNKTQKISELDEPVIIHKEEKVEEPPEDLFKI